MSKNALAPHWIALKAQLLAEHHDIEEGRMMSSEALTHNGKVFAFFATLKGAGGLGLRVGRDFDMTQYEDCHPLAPFKTKPPLKDWIILGGGALDSWRTTARAALECSRKRET